MKIEIEFPGELDRTEHDEIVMMLSRSLASWATPYTPKITISQSEPTSIGGVPDDHRR